MNDKSKLDEALSKLTSKQFKFWELMQSGKLTQVQCYRKCYNVDKSSDFVIKVNASRLWNNTKFILIRNAFTNTITSQTIKAKEVAYCRNAGLCRAM